MNDEIGEMIQDLLERHCSDPGSWRSEISDGSLSEKEYVVYRLTRAGLSEGEIADALDISVGTVRGKKGRIREKMSEVDATQDMLENWGEM